MVVFRTIVGPTRHRLRQSHPRSFAVSSLCPFFRPYICSSLPTISFDDDNCNLLSEIPTIAFVEENRSIVGSVRGSACSGRREESHRENLTCAPAVAYLLIITVIAFVSMALSIASCADAAGFVDFRPREEGNLR